MSCENKDVNVGFLHAVLDPSVNNNKVPKTHLLYLKIGKDLVWIDKDM